jgi:PPK2 family polyphosphate:nucleotide phosphotransferase
MKLPCQLERFQVVPDEQVDLASRPTEVEPLYSSKKQYRSLLKDCREELGELQNILYAHDRYALLLIFQGMDAAGKDGAIRHVMSGVNPQGCQVFSFKEPSSEELDHDFLWRTNKRLPERGRIGIFNRSYYEEVLVARVLPGVLARQRIPDEFVDTETIWRERQRDIVNVEHYLHRNGTRIVKFFLHLSKKEQRKRFLSRIDEPDKNWKLTAADVEMRAKWDEYQHAYADCLGATSTAHAPWYIIPADDKRNARLLISCAIIEAMRSLDIAYPEPTDEHRRELKAARSALETGDD